MQAAFVHRASRRLAAAFAAAVALLCSSAPGAAGNPVSHPLAQSPARVRDYWTPQRLESAQPLDTQQAPEPAGSLASPSSTGSEAGGHPVEIHPTVGDSAYDYQPGSETSYPQRVHGKIFFSVPDQGDFACSGTLVSSLMQNVVFTAGHCVYDVDSQQWSTNFVFIPAYRDGAAPLGVYPATSLISTDQWTSSGDLSYDVGIAELATPLEAQIGARGVVFDKPPRSSYQIFGYPGLPSPPYDGQKLIACDASFYALENTGHPFSTLAYPCNMEQGSSGGGWVTPAGDVASVVSHGSCDQDPSTCGQIAGPYFGEEIKKLYDRAGGSAECPPAEGALGVARKQRQRARRAARHSSSRRMAKRLKRANRRFRKAQSRRDSVC